MSYVFSLQSLAHRFGISHPNVMSTSMPSKRLLLGKYFQYAHCEDPYKEYSHVYVYMCDTVNALIFVDTNFVVWGGKIYISISRFSLRDKVTLRLLKLKSNSIIYVWKLNQTVLELNLWADKFLFFPRRDLNTHHVFTAAAIP
jgi:hypothetical protein